MLCALGRLYYNDHYNIASCINHKTSVGMLLLQPFQYIKLNLQVYTSHITPVAMGYDQR